MESAAIVEMVKRAPSRGYVIHWIVSDDDSTMRAHVAHPKTPEGRRRPKSDQGKLPRWILQPEFKADPTHRNKVVSSKFYDLAKAPVRTSRLTNQIARRLKKDWGYMIAQCKHKPMDEFVVGAKAVLQHIYNNHEFCGEWCDAKKALTEKKPYSHPEGWLSRKDPEQEKMYHQVLAVTEKYGSHSYLEQSHHKFNTQTNEALNNGQVVLTPKSKVFHSSKAFHYRDAIVIGTHNWGFSKYWLRTFDCVGVRYTNLLADHLKRVQIKRESDKVRKKRPEVKRKRAHKQAATERKLLYEARTTEYESGIGLDIGHTKEPEDKPPEKEKKACRACGQFTHKTRASRLCPYNKKNVARRKEAEESKSDTGDKCTTEEKEEEKIDSSNNENNVQLV